MHFHYQAVPTEVVITRHSSTEDVVDGIRVMVTRPCLADDPISGSHVAMTKLWSAENVVDDIRAKVARSRVAVAPLSMVAKWQQQGLSLGM